MPRFEDRGLTLRLFMSRDEALHAPRVTAAWHYACGWLGKDLDGRWVDGHGQLPVDWVPDEQLFAEIRQGG